MISATSLKALIKENRIEEVLSQLEEETKDTPWHNEIIQLATRYKKHSQRERLDTHSEEVTDQSLHKIQHSLLQIIDQIAEVPPRKKKVPWSIFFLIIVVIGILLCLAEWLNIINVIPNRNFSLASNTVTILVRKKGTTDQRVLTNRGEVTLIYGDAPIPKVINLQGEITFQQIADVFFTDEVSVKIHFRDPEGEPYRAAYPDSLYQLRRGDLIVLEVELEGMEEIHGIVKDFVTGDLLEGVQVRALSRSDITDQFGEFRLQFSEEIQQPFITLRASRAGYAPWELQDIPTTTNQEQTIGLKPKK